MPLPSFAASWGVAALLLGTAALPQSAEADQSGAGPSTLAPVTVEATAIPGDVVKADEIPGNVETLSAADISRRGPASLTGALERQLGSINVNDNLADPFQPDIQYRGMAASPVLGTAQGLAVYQNGVRINEAFGDTVNWDLIPSLAIDRITLVSSSPVYGLNALGGGLSVSMKNGFTSQAADAQLYGGSYARRAATAEYGRSFGHFGLYIAGDALNQDGWREFASDAVRQLYAALSARSERASLDLSYTAAHDDLAGQGAAPVQELAISRWLVFTGPQETLNRLSFVTLNGSLRISDSLSLHSVLYDRRYRQTVSNGDTTDYTACTDGVDGLCQSDGTTPLTDSAGRILPDISAGGTIRIGQNDFERISAYGRGAALQVTDSASLAGHGNEFSAGVTYDYSGVDFYSETQLGPLDSQLTVLPSGLIVDTPEDSPFVTTPVSLRALNEYSGLYATDTFRATDRLALTVGARYNVADIELRDRRGTELTGDSRFTHINPAIGVTERLRPGLTAYVGFSQNARTPTASEIECSNPLQPCLLPSSLASDPPNLRQVVSETYELGLRGRVTVHGTSPAAAAWRWHVGAFRTNLYDDIYGIATSLSRSYFQNIGSTRRQGIEAGVDLAAAHWSAHLDYSLVDASFRSALTLPSPSNPFQDANGDIHVLPGDHLPGIPQQRLKLGLEYRHPGGWSVGTDLSVTSNQYYFGDESNQNAPLPGHVELDLYGTYRVGRHLELFATVNNLLNAHYATYGTFGDPTGIGAPGIPSRAVTNGPGVDNRFQSPAAPVAAFGGVRIRF